MVEMNLLDKVRSGPVTQSLDGVRALLSWRGHLVSPMPTDVTLDNGRMVLVLSNKKDAYYTCTARACSCPSAIYRHNGPCKHQRKYFPVAKAEQPAEAGSIKPAATWPGGHRGPVEDDLTVAV